MLDSRVVGMSKENAEDTSCLVVIQVEEVENESLQSRLCDRFRYEFICIKNQWAMDEKHRAAMVKDIIWTKLLIHSYFELD